MTKITIDNNEEVFILKLQALYDIETSLEKALPKMAKAAKDKELKEGFTMHLAETKEHSRRLESIFKMLRLKLRKEKSEGIRGIIKDGEWVIKQVKGPAEVKDAMLASSARYAEHYEMAGYLSAIEGARLFGMNEVEHLLGETLAEEEEADIKLEKVMQKNLRSSYAE